MTEIAVFPIPQCVAFPGTHFPLHVFEPRYRTMVEHCIETGLPLAICHVEKQVREAPKDQTLSEALNSNQATYRPVQLVTAGECRLHETLQDGRMMISVALDQRYRLDREVQALPFMIFDATPVDDDPMSPEEAHEAQLLKDKLMHRLLALTADSVEIQATLNSDTWIQKPVDAFSFELFSLLQTDPDIMQNLLEMRSPLARMKTALDLLSEVPAQL
ncbi:LON peptidase substrate-binding domain-containing protein [Reinekea blandensis]|nr:LON peptidase substrate-binding domain-containing protein [Reinekea blandensis]